MTLRYAHLAPEHLRAEMLKTEGAGSAHDQHKVASETLQLLTGPESSSISARRTQDAIDHPRARAVQGHRHDEGAGRSEILRGSK